MTDPQSMAAQRAKWRKYFEQIITGPDGEVEAAADGAMEAIARRADQAGVIAAGRAAAAEYRANGGRRKPSMPPPAAQPRPAAAAPPSRPQAGPAYAYAQPAAAPTARPAAAPNARSVGNGRSGVVTGLQQRQEMAGRTYFQVWNFRLERRDAQGGPLPPVPVEMRARSFRGQIANGDVVEIPSSSRPMRLKNLTTGATVKARGRPHPFLRGVGLTLFLILFVCVAIFIVANIIEIQGSR
ncbi:MAG: hypothetical protein HOU81_02545 [Hamadaea sp.]|uniref:hypothetical protein n=1 Tax=Hamadaea sp. TaxID=2024425 RepID=UPI00180C3205|nr:hypothetical protein [Hamadaea sp.]NUR69675.1 hypothetical protein [Hamadaea sp.]NUT19542.1 hypothetical protein [Hamadaea sp.]